ncbi:MlaA family lipoprotein [Novosphingobium sediminicola]|uniref:Phospholipid-binding lipoprotein MlaA n=1 Tax=Novosphingobium sediminicola TaxID=563162 RepID=A0A7W6G7W1_9SPHN|nr:VacJ family lipoprotein [Novosphingobium sediminicola]MBB3956590.1 phospholipid-binding lipoprotein MlaA [Novosphingobium sediminicola]
MIVMPLSALLLASVSSVPVTAPAALGSSLLAQANDAPHIAALPLDGVAGDSQQTTPSAPQSEASAPQAEAPAAQSAPPADNGPAPANAAPVDAAPVDAAPASEPMLLRDPWHKPNRDIFAFDVFFERKMLAPVAHGYRAVTPQIFRAGVNNAILNLDEPSTAINQVVQLKIGRALKTTVRFAINSTIGIGGLIDVASAGGLRRRPADFGQTLGRYGAKPGPYVMLPFLGPSNVRDGFGRLVDTFTDPVGFVIGGIFTSPGGAARFAMAGINWREKNDGTMSAIYGASDPYAFTRAAYSQQRAAVVQDATGKAAALPDF